MRKAYAFINKTYGYICRAEVYIAMVLLTLMVVLVFSTAILRTLGNPVIWAIDASTFIFAWVVFLIADACFRNDKLVKLELFINMVPEKYQVYIKIFNYIVILIFLVVLVVYGSYLTYTTRFRVFQGINVSYSFVTASVPLGFLLMSITSIRKIVESINELRQKSTKKD